LSKVDDSSCLLAHAAAERDLLYRLISAKTNVIEIVCIGNIADHVLPPWNVTRRFDIQDRIENGRMHELAIGIPERAPSPQSTTLILYATAGLLSAWERVEDDVDLCFARGYGQVILALRTHKFRILALAEHSYLLSVILSSFPRRKFWTKLEVYVPQPRWMPDPENPSPTHFSALIISAEPRRRSARLPNACGEGAV
jgi:hypothetical protein